MFISNLNCQTKNTVYMYIIKDPYTHCVHVSVSNNLKLTYSVIGYFSWVFIVKGKGVSHFIKCFSKDFVIYLDIVIFF